MVARDREAEIVEAVSLGLWIGGSRPATDGAVLPVDDPSTGQVLAEVADASPVDALAALDLAVATQESWAATAPREHGEILRRAFELMTARADYAAESALAGVRSS
jgi:succinate-semialdehyde dehydrogenase/glutarate-semialdehyde dehydrogenase